MELPVEVQAHIYSFLGSLPILLSLASVCKALNQLVSEELPWLLSEISFHRCANRVDDALMEQMLRRNLSAKTPFRPRHLNFSGCHNISLDMLNRLTINGDALRTLKLAGCFHLFANPHATTDSDDEYDDAQLDNDDDDDKEESSEEKRLRDSELARLRDHRLKLRELTLRLHTITTLDLAGCYTVGAAVYLEKILAASVNVVDLNIAGWTLRKTLGSLLSECGKLQRLSLANVQPSIDKDNLKGLSFACPLIRALDLSGARAPNVESFGRYFAFLERVVLVRVSTVVHDEWSHGQEVSGRLVVLPKASKLSDPRLPHGNREIRVVQHTFNASSPSALSASLASAESRGVDIDGMLLIRHRHIKLGNAEEVEVMEKGVIGTLLTQAIYLANPDMVEAVLEHGANPNLANASDGQSPLYIATRYFKCLAQSIRHNRHRAELRPELPKLLNARDRMRSIIDLLLDYNASAAPIPNEEGSCFAEAVLSADLDLVKRLLTVGRLKAEEQVKPNARTGYSILQALMCETFERERYSRRIPELWEMAAFLVEIGADPFKGEDDDGYTPWEKALEKGRACLVETIVHHFDLDLAAFDRTVVRHKKKIAVTALQFAAFHCNEGVVRLLLKLGATDDATAHLEKKYKKRFTWQCDNFTRVAHRQKLADNGHTQENRPHLAVVSERVVDIFKVAKGTKDTYLHSQIADININVLALVLENGVDPNLKNAKGDTAGHIVMRKGMRRHWRHDGSWSIAEGLTPYLATPLTPINPDRLKDREKLRMLHVYGADLDIANDAKGATLLHMAVNNNDADTAKLLLDACGVAPDPLDASGLTPLQLAVSNRRVGLVELLVTCGANASQRVSAAMARFIAKRCAELAKQEAEWRARRAAGKRGKRKRRYDDDAGVTDGLAVPFDHFLRHTPQKDMVLPMTTKPTLKAKTKANKKRKNGSEDGDDSDGDVVGTKERKRKRSTTMGEAKTNATKKKKRKTTDGEETEQQEEREEDHEQQAKELAGKATMLHAVALIYGRCGENLHREVPTKTQHELATKASSKRKRKSKRSAKAKQGTRGADPNVTDARGNTALHAFASLGLRQVVVALMLSGANVMARNDDGRLPLSLLPEFELVLLEKNAALLPSSSATRHLLQSLLARHHEAV